MFSGCVQFRDSYFDTNYIVHSNGAMVVVRIGVTRCLTDY